MPAVLLRPEGVAVDFVVRSGMIRTLSLASFATVNSRRDHPVQDIVEVERGTGRRAEHRPGRRIPALFAVGVQDPRQDRDDRDGGLRSFGLGLVDVPLPSERLT